jgi:hypothetical protein
VTPSKATLNSAIDASRRDSSIRLPAQRWRVRRTESPSLAALKQLATMGRLLRAPACAITSLPRSVPEATTALASTSAASSSSDRAHATGANAVNVSLVTR